jgi:hypothetical protein
MHLSSEIKHCFHYLHKSGIAGWQGKTHVRKSDEKPLPEPLFFHDAKEVKAAVCIIR